MAETTDVLVVGAGPGGALAAGLLARAGLRVTVLDRCRFPRPKLCGDTLNPGAVALLRRHFDLASLEASATPIDGMLLSGPGPVFVRGEYGGGVRGLGVTRHVLDAWLVARAVESGAQLVEGAIALAPERNADGVVTGVRVRHGGGEQVYRSTITLAADGRRSRIASACGLSACAARPRRWAIGGYFDGVEGLSRLGEMHVRASHYIGVAPGRDGRANACVVLPFAGGGAWPSPDALLRGHLDADPVLGLRFARARPASPVTMLGPLAVETPVPGCPGLLLVGDAAGFIDPMTGDGIRLALASAEVAAEIAVRVLAGTEPLATAHLAYARRVARRVGWKRTFNRGLRTLVASGRAVAWAARLATRWPAPLRAVIRYAGDAPAWSAR